MKKLKLFMQVLCISLVVFSCSKEGITSAEIETQNASKTSKIKAPQPYFENYSDLCANGPQIKIKFSTCHYSSAFFVNVYKSNGTHVYSWPVDNSSLAENVAVTVGSLPFTFINGDTTCSLLSEGNTYYFDVTNSPSMSFSTSFENFYVPVNGCECTG